MEYHKLFGGGNGDFYKFSGNSVCENGQLRQYDPDYRF